MVFDTITQIIPLGIILGAITFILWKVRSQIIKSIVDIAFFSYIVMVIAFSINRIVDIEGPLNIKQANFLTALLFVGIPVFHYARKYIEDFK